MPRLFLALLLVCSSALNADSPSSAVTVGRQLQDAQLNEGECFRVRDLAFQRDEAKFYLTEGHLIFSKPVEGRRFAAVFTADIPGGDAEIILLPPYKSERMSLAALAKTPNLNEHFATALFLFTDGSGEEWLKQILESPSVRKEAEVGVLLKSSFEPVLRNLTSSYEIRLVRDLLLPGSSAEKGFLYAMLSGRKLGNFDVLYDPRTREQLVVGQLVYRNERQFFDIWTSFEARSFRNGSKKPASSPFNISDIAIDATIDPSLHLTASTRMRLTATEATERVLGFEISRQMKVTEVKVDGVPAEVFRRDSLRASLLKGGNNESLLVVMPAGLKVGQTYTLDFAHEGNVISRAGEGIYYVGSRGSWYPNSDFGFSKYDLTFRYPKNLGLVATGDVVQDRTEGEWRVTRRTTQAAIRFAGFNLGTYEKAAVSRAGYTVEVYANKRVEDALRTPLSDTVFVSPGRTGLRRSIEPLPQMVVRPNPTARLQQLATEIGSAMEFMGAHFGPPPLKTLTVSPIPGMFGQGFPGLLYLSTLSYLSPGERPLRSESLQTFFSELLHAHETAHQWWGNLVVTTSYQDEWLMESLANYSAILMLERKKGKKAVETVLESYRDHLLAKDESGKAIEAAGPIVWGLRLVKSSSPNSWRVITYEKGTWIIHMLRMQLGDERFLKMLGELARRKAFQSVTTEEFRLIAAEFLPPKSDDPKLEAFFEQWVHGTGIPTLKMTYKVTGKAPKVRIQGNVAQTDVDEDFTSRVPVEVLLPGKKTSVKWVRVSSETGAFSIDLPVLPSKVSLDPGYSVLAKH